MYYYDQQYIVKNTILVPIIIHIEAEKILSDKTKAVLGLKVSDGEGTSPPQYLRISTYPLSIKLKHNTGLVVVHRSFSYLTPANLSFATNAAEDSRIEIRYSVIRPPQYGILQRQRESNQPWTNTDHFTSRDLEQQAVRY